ncbi:MAG: iron-sulfur cluster carrier protein ApbC [Beijerinckiaceae bacterium]|nr:MAG: iron-sulfur cluster carrier protein ApbC [Beijerinckiaceae bacterium]
MVSEQEVLNVLQSVSGPDGKTPLPQSGAIAGLSMKEGRVYLSIGIDPARAASMEGMRAAAEKALRDMPGVTNVLVSLTAEKAAPPAGASPPRPHPHAAHSMTIPGVKHIIAVASGKGGVGKSTTAVNLALSLAAIGWRIGILDLDVFGPSLPRLLGTSDKPQLVDRRIQPLNVYGVKAMSIGFMVPEAEAVVWRGPMVTSAVQQMLRDVAWGECDCLVIDMPPGTGDTQLSLAQTVALSGAVIVSTPQDLALIDARRGVAMFNKVGVPILGVVENMSYFLCPHCGGRSEIFAHGGARHEAEKLGVPFLGEIPLTMAIREHADSGRPVVVTDPDSAYSSAYRQIAEKVRASLEYGHQHAAPKIVIG